MLKQNGVLIAQMPLRHSGGAVSSTRSLWGRDGSRLNSLGVLGPLAAVPHGHLAPSAWVLPQRSGGMASRAGTSFDVSTATNLAGGVGIVGTTSLVVSPIGILHAVSRMVGAMSAAFSAAGTIRARAYAVGASSFSVTTGIPTIVGAAPAVGSSTFTVSATATGKLIARAVGSSTFTVSVAGLARSIVTIAGGASFSVSTTGALRGESLLAGSLGFSVDVAATIRAIGFLSGDIQPFTELSPQSLAAAVWSAQAAENNAIGSMGERLIAGGLTVDQAQQLLDIAKLHGLIPGMPLVVTETTRVAGDVSQTIEESAGTVTVERV